MAGKKLPTELTARMLEEGRGPGEIAEYLRKHQGIDVTESAISMFRRRHTDVPAALDNRKRVPWKVKPEHYNSKYRFAILAWHQREEDRPLHPERERNLLRLEAELVENGRVIDYSPRSKNGWRVVPARPGIDLGIVREPDDVPRPPRRGPYAVRAAESA